MAYEIHIVKADGITEDQWRNAVGATKGVKLDPSDIVAANPTTGEEIRIAGNSTNAAVLIGGEWAKVFRYGQGAASFAVRDETIMVNEEHPVRSACAALARLLCAQIEGDEGETYDW